MGASFVPERTNLSFQILLISNLNSTTSFQVLPPAISEKQALNIIEIDIMNVYTHEYSYHNHSIMSKHMLTKNTS